MQLTKLILKNFRTHKSASFEFSEGITGIIGGNGSGKSSIVEAIIFLLTGEGYGKTKSDMLTVGQTSGYVIGHLLINEKEAVLERHIDTAKVNFMYDGKVYKKSSEVNEIWDSLFQIDKNIVQNVIVSNQGEIALLFNGDNSTKEKLFQKIFMVPNTTKLRDTIWNNYLKEAPPEYPVKDLVLLNSDIQCLEKIVELSKIELKELSVDEEEYTRLIARQAFLEAVEKSSEWHSELSHELKKASDSIASWNTEAYVLENKMSFIRIEDYRECWALQKASKSLYEAKLQWLEKEAALRKPKVARVTKENLVALQQGVADLEAVLKVKRAALIELNKKIEEYEKSGLGSGTCPTCGSSVDDVVKLIAHLDSERVPILAEGKAKKAELSALTEQLTLSNAAAAEWEAYEHELHKINSSLDTYKELNFDPETYELCESVVTKYSLWEEKLNDINKHKSAATAKETDIQLQLAALASYDKDPVEFASETIAVREKIGQIQKSREAIRSLEISVATDERELKSLRQDLLDNNGYLEKNKKRQEYTSVLKSLYDLFHTGKFPRALIQTYSSTVTEYMNEVLSSFDFPYTAKVNEAFGIDIYNEEGLALPSISGGQQVMVGFSLRLALHNMFVGAFPFMIVDEGSYGLNGENAKKYFEIIKSLGKGSKFKQVIVIDHHSELSDYVDNTISL